MKHNGKMLIQVLTGNVLLAFAVCVWIVPNRLLSGGSTGLVMMIRHWLPLRFSVVSMMVNSILFFMGLVFLGRRFAMTSLCSTLLYPGILAILEEMPLKLFALSPWAAAVLGGILCGVGIGLVIRAGGSTGGMDIPPCILKKYRGIPVGTSMLAFDSLIFLAQLAWNRPEGIACSLVLIVLTSWTVNRVANGNLTGTGKLVGAGAGT